MLSSYQPDSLVEAQRLHPGRNAGTMNELFLRLIQPFPLREACEIRENDLHEIKSSSIENNLFPLVYAQLQKYQHYISPAKLGTHFLEESKGLYLHSISISVKQEAVEKEIISLLENRRVQSVVIKGNQIAKEIYGDPNCRISSDIDILIRREDAIKADTILSEAGFIPEEGMPLVYCLARIHHAAYRHPASNMLIELHWGFGVPYFFNLSAEEIWREVVPAESGQAMLSPEMTLIMLLVHHHSHAFRELKILVDILWALHKYEDVIDWHRFVLRIKKAGLFRTVLVTLNQTKSLWGTVTDRMKAVMAVEKDLPAMGHRLPSLLMWYFRMDIGSDTEPNLYKDKLVARFALDHWFTIISSYYKTLFPSPEAIKEFYRDRRSWSLPFNYLKFIRWRVKDWMRG